MRINESLFIFPVARGRRCPLASLYAVQRHPPLPPTLLAPSRRIHLIIIIINSINNNISHSNSSSSILRRRPRRRLRRRLPHPVPRWRRLPTRRRCIRRHLVPLTSQADATRRLIDRRPTSRRRCTIIIIEICTETRILR